MRLSELNQPTIKLVISAARGPRGLKGDKGDKGNDGDLTPLAQAAADQIALDASAALAAAAEATNAATSASGSAVSATNSANAAAGSATSAADSAADASTAQIAAEAAQAAAEAAAGGSTTDSRFADWSYWSNGIKAVNYQVIGVSLNGDDNGVALLYADGNSANNSTGGVYFESYNQNKWWGANGVNAGYVEFWTNLTHFEFDSPVQVPAQPYGPAWAGSISVPTKNDVFDEIEPIKEDIQALYDLAYAPRYIHYGAAAESEILADEILMRYTNAIHHTLPDNFLGTIASVVGLPTLGTWTVELIRKPVGGGITQPIGSVSITTAGVISYSDAGMNARVINVGDVLTLKAPSSADPGVTGFSVTFQGIIT